MAFHSLPDLRPDGRAPLLRQDREAPDHLRMHPDSNCLSQLFVLHLEPIFSDCLAMHYIRITHPPIRTQEETPGRVGDRGHVEEEQQPETSILSDHRFSGNFLFPGGGGGPGFLRPVPTLSGRSLKFVALSNSLTVSGAISPRFSIAWNFRCCARDAYGT